MLTFFFYFFSYGKDKYIINSDYISNSVVMADQFRSEGKIYVVVVILFLILLFLIIYLFYIDRKINFLKKKIINNINKKKNNFK
ncbi:MAG: CcmD family protein [Cytophagales bacterium]